MADTSILVNPTVSKRFAAALEHRRVVLFCAPCGSGKTTTAKALLRDFSVEVRSAADPGCLTQPWPHECEILELDDMQLLDDEADQQELVDLIVGNDRMRFVLLTRGAVPGWLLPFQLAGIMETFTLDDLLFDTETSRVLIESTGVSLNASELVDIQRETSGYPIALRFLADRLAAGEPYCTATLDATRHDIFCYFDEAVYRRFPRALRNLLLCLAPFDSFTVEMAEAISDEEDAGGLVGALERDTTMLTMDGLGVYRFRRIFHQFLSWRVLQEYTLPDRRALYERAGRYYEAEDDIVHALECYSQGACTHKVTALLERHAALHPGIGHYYETERFYRALPEEDLLKSPTLMCGMSMLCALTVDFEASEDWYDKLCRYAASLSRADAEYREAHAYRLSGYCVAAAG